jgi:hypothetical protein
MAVYAPSGSYPEGPGYWAYGTSYNVLLLAVLDSVFGTDFGLSQAPGFDQTGQFPSLACGPSGLYFNFADGGAGRGPLPILHWFASKYDRPDWLYGEADRLRALVDKLLRADSASYGGRLLPFSLLWMRDWPDEAMVRMPLHWNGKGETPITVHRSSWSAAGATYVGLKAGSPSANHGQMDIGSFVLDSDGQRWAMDLGAEGYHRIESRGMNLWSRAQNSDRWKIFRQSNLGHNTLVIDGQPQRASGHAPIVSFSSEPAFPHSVVDMSSVYESQAKSVCRGVALLSSREALVQDELTGLTAGSRVRWGIVTPGAPERLGAASAILRHDDAELTLTILAPQATTWKAIETAEPRNVWDSPNPGTRMLAFEATAPVTGTLTLAVLATPGSCTASLTEALDINPLKDWNSIRKEP